MVGTVFPTTGGARRAELGAVGGGATGGRGDPGEVGLKALSRVIGRLKDLGWMTLVIEFWHGDLLDPWGDLPGGCGDRFGA